MNNQDIKVYIAGKVSGEPYESCKEKFNHRAEILRKQGYEVVDPMEIVPKESNWQQAMRICICAITECQAYFMLEDWRYSKGAKIELNLMLGLGLKKSKWKTMNTDITLVLPNVNTIAFLGTITREMQVKKQWNNAGIELRTALSLCEKVSKKLRTKAISKEGTIKPVKIKLPYEYASTLFLLLKNCKDYIDISPEDFYTENTLQNIINELHKQLI